MSVVRRTPTASTQSRVASRTASCPVVTNRRHMSQCNCAGKGGSRMPVVDMLWSGWGDPERAERLPDSVTGCCASCSACAHASRRQPVKLAEIEPPAPPRRSRWPPSCGEEHVRTDDETRIRHTRGKSTTDLLRIRAGDARTAPDAVVLPGSHDEVAAVLARVRRAPDGRRAVRRGHLGRRRAHPGGGRLRRGGRARPAPPRPARRPRRRLPYGHASARPAGPARRRAAQRAGLHPRPLPAVLRVGEHRRVRRRPVLRAGVGRVRAVRRDGPRRSRSPRRPARSRPAVRPARRPGPTCASSCSAPRARSA